MTLSISFQEGECDRIFSQMQDLMQDLDHAYGGILSAKEGNASQWGGDSSKTFIAHMLELSERLKQVKGRWQELVSRYEKARDCVRRLNEISFA